jgi:hypothetical protein
MNPSTIVRHLLDRLFPAHVDNRFPGHRLALWLFGLFVTLRLIMGTNGTFNAHAVATGADGISFEGLAPATAETLLLMFARLSLSQLMLALLSLVVLIRYKALVPLMYLVLLTELVGRRALALVLMQATDRAGPLPVGAYINMGLLALLVAGLALSLLGTPRPTRSSASA